MQLLIHEEGQARLKHLLIKLDIYNAKLMDPFIQCQREQDVLKQLSRSVQCVARLYLLEGFDFSSRDIGSFSDPYVVVKCGNKVESRRECYQEDEPNPSFYEVFDFDVTFPGAQSIVIEAYDYDVLFGDDLIGRTVIDLDDRYYSNEWRQLK